MRRPAKRYSRLHCMYLGSKARQTLVKAPGALPPRHSHHDGNCSLLGQLEIWPSITVESETAIRADIDGELRDILLLLTECVTHAITSGRDVGEGHARGSLGDLLSGAFDLNRGDLPVLIKAHGAITREDQVHVQDKWNLPFVVTIQGSNCNSLLGQLEIWPSVTVESETAIRVDIDGELRDILLL